MLYPIRNSYRQYFELNDFWDIRFDPDDKGLEKKIDRVLALLEERR